MFTMYLVHITFATASERQMKRIRSKLFESILRQDMAFFDKKSPGELNTIMTENLKVIRQSISEKFSDCLSQIITGVACYIVATVYSWKFTIVFLAILPLMIMSLTLMLRYLKKYSVQEFVAYGDAGKLSQECLSSIRTVTSFGIQHKALKSYNEKLKAAERVSIAKGFLKGFFEGSYFGLLGILFAVAIVYAVYLFQNDCEDYTVSNLTSAFFSILVCSTLLGNSFPFLSIIGSSRGVAKRVFDIIDLKPKIDIKNTKKKT